MQLREIDLLIKNGAFDRCDVCAVLDGDSFSCTMCFFKPNGDSVFLRTQRDSIRVFKSVDAAMKVAVSLGLSKVNTIFS